MSSPREGARPSAADQAEALKVTTVLTGALADLVAGEACWLTRKDLRAIVTPEGALAPAFLATFNSGGRKEIEAWFGTCRPAVLAILERSPR